jgi:hypothetical protein
LPNHHELEVVEEHRRETAYIRVRRIGTVHDLQMDVRVDAVPAVAALRQSIPRANPLAGLHRDRALLEMSQEHEGVAFDLENDEVAEDPIRPLETIEETPAREGLATLSIGNVVDHANYTAVDRGQHRLPEAVGVLVVAGLLRPRGSAAGTDGREVPGEIATAPPDPVIGGARVSLGDTPVALEGQTQPQRLRCRIETHLHRLV